MSPMLMDHHPIQQHAGRPQHEVTRQNARFKPTSPKKSVDGGAISGQSYKASTIVNYDSRVVPDLKIPHITTLES